MWRAFFLALGISMTILGAECLVVEQAELTRKAEAASASGFYMPPVSSGGRVIRPPEWVPWTFMSAGAVVIIYSFTIPKRVSG